jgi:hypothetical protein
LIKHKKAEREKDEEARNRQKERNNIKNISRINTVRMTERRAERK